MYITGQIREGLLAGGIAQCFIATNVEKAANVFQKHAQEIFQCILPSLTKEKEESWKYFLADSSSKPNCCLFSNYHFYKMDNMKLCPSLRFLDSSA